MEQNTQKSYIITKRISKHGKQVIIVIPSCLQHDLRPQTVVEVKISVIKEAEDKTSN